MSQSRLGKDPLSREPASSSAAESSSRETLRQIMDLAPATGAQAGAEAGEQVAAQFSAALERLGRLAGQADATALVRIMKALALGPGGVEVNVQALLSGLVAQWPQFEVKLGHVPLDLAVSPETALILGRALGLILEEICRPAKDSAGPVVVGCALAKSGRVRLGVSGPRTCLRLEGSLLEDKAGRELTALVGPQVAGVSLAQGGNFVEIGLLVE